MTTYSTYSQSLRLLPTDPVTPLHSPHDSVNSSTSSRARTPLQPLTIHQYRKQQNSPAPQLATPPGKTLRRRPATPALNDLERTPSVSTTTPLAASRSPSQPLHFSHSAHQLAYQSLPPSPPPCGEHQSLLGQPLRSQSAEPYTQLALRSLQHTANKVRKFKPIKKLPKPPVATGFAVPSPLAITPTPSPKSPGYTSFLDDLVAGDGQQSPSTRSLSQLPQTSLNDDHTRPHRVVPTSFTTITPETPPATPAVIHYRGASFDLVNPHDSLCYANIVTPSRDLDSTDYLPLPSTDDQSDTDEMGPKRALYSDLSTAYNSIRARQGEEEEVDDDQTHGENVSRLNYPTPPVPAAHPPNTPTSPYYASGSPYSSPTSPSYAERLRSPTSASPLQPHTPSESRFKRLTRTLTKKLGKSPAPEEDEEELQDMSPSRIGLASPSFAGGYPRRLSQSYHDVEEDATPAEPAAAMVSPIVRHRRETYSRLTSMIPESDLSSSLEANPYLQPPHDNRPSVYASSSVYSDSRPQSFQPIEPLSAGSRRQSRPPISLQKTDTIDRFINDYQRADSSEYSQMIYPPNEDRSRSGQTQTNFGLSVTEPSVEAGRARRLGDESSSPSPPDEAASQVDAFEYDDLLRSSPYSSEVTSYGDTRQLLRVSQPTVLRSPSQTIEPSSSYSQSEAENPSPVSKEALDHADKIFGNVEQDAEPERSIPAMWSRQASGHQLRSRRHIQQATEPDPDWQTVRGSQQTEASEESIADYSSDEEDNEGKDQLGFPSTPTLHPEPLNVSRSRNVSQPTTPPATTYQQSFTSSPPQLSPLRSDSGPPPSSPLPTLPPTETLRGRSGTVGTSSSIAGPSATWVNRGQFSDKETQELLASGPNDDIIYNTQEDTGGLRASSTSTVRANRPATGNSSSPYNEDQRRGSQLVRDHIKKLPTLASRRRSRIPTGQFYTTAGRTSSVTPVHRAPTNPFRDPTDTTPSRTSLYSTQGPSSRDVSDVGDNEGTPAPRRMRRESRAAVPGQTRLRQMTLVSAHSRPSSRPDSDRPSTYMTSTRQSSNRPSSAPASEVQSRTESAQHILAPSNMIHEHTPRLLRPERAVEEEEEKERSIKSWAIFLAFCLFPPLLMLYQPMADFIIVNMTHGRLTHAAERPKKHALAAGVILTFGVAGGILLPILVAWNLDKL